MAEPSTAENDQAITAAVGPDVVLAGDETLIKTPQADQLLRTTPLPQMTDAGARTGIASITLNGDGIFRNIPSYEDGFAMELAKAAGIKAPHLPAGSLIQSFGPARSYPTVSYYQALDPKNFLPPDIFKGRVVLVGLSLQNAPEIDQGGADAYATPYTVHTGKLISGVEVQATIYDNIVHGLAITEAGLLPVATCILISVVLAATTVWKSTSWRTLVATAAAVLAFAAASYAGIRFGHVFVSPLGPTVAFVAVAFGQAAFDYTEERRQKRQITLRLRPIYLARSRQAPVERSLAAEARRRAAHALGPVFRRARLHHHRRNDEGRSRAADGADQPAADAAIRCRHGSRRHDRQIYGRLHHGLLERAARRPRSCPACGQGLDCHAGCDRAR